MEVNVEGNNKLYMRTGPYEINFAVRWGNTLKGLQKAARLHPGFGLCGLDPFFIFL